MRKILLSIGVLVLLFSCTHEKILDQPVKGEKENIVSFERNNNKAFGEIHKVTKLILNDEGLGIFFKALNRYYLLSAFPKNKLDVEKLKNFLNYLPIHYEYDQVEGILLLKNALSKKILFTTQKVNIDLKDEVVYSIQLGMNSDDKNLPRLMSPAKGCNSCTSGGAGSTSCSVGDMISSCSVSCGEGYYACCNGDSNTCYCCEVTDKK